MAATLPVRTRNGRSELTTVFWELVAAEHRNVAAAALVTRRDIKKPSTWYARGEVNYAKPSLKGNFRQAPNVFKVPTSGITPLSKANPSSVIGFLDREAGGPNPAAEVAERFTQLFNRIAPRRLGRYQQSLFYVLNKRHRSLFNIKTIAQTNPLGPRETIIISTSASEYAAAIERAAVMRGEAGIFRRVAQLLIEQFGARASIKFTYIDNVSLGVPYHPGPNWKAQGGIMLPVILIGGPGQYPSQVTSNIGRHEKRRARQRQREADKRKGYI